MPIYTDQFYVMDPANPPSAGATLTMVRLDVNDVNANGVIRAGNGDTVGGLVVNSVWLNDTITVTMGGVTRTVTGVTFYRTSGTAVFTPTDGTVLGTATFVRSTYVTSNTQVAVGSFGPACFLRGTMLDTPQGPRRIDNLRAGDLVLTRDNGAQRVVWVGHTKVDADGEDAPIRFAPGSIGNVAPLLVSPLHRILVGGARAQLYFGCEEVFIHAKHLVNGRSIRAVPRAQADYYHVMFDRHQIVTAYGAASESFYPGDTIMQGNAHIRAEVLAIYPELANPQAAWPLARRMLRGHEAAVLLGRAIAKPAPIRLDLGAVMGKMQTYGNSPQNTAQIIPFAPRRAA